VTVEEGQVVILRCPGSVENQRVTWWKKESGSVDRIVFDGAVLSHLKDRVSFDSTTGILTIHKAKLSDSGVFLCGVGFKEVSFEIHLTVLGKF